MTPFCFETKTFQLCFLKTALETVKTKNLYHIVIKGYVVRIHCDGLTIFLLHHNRGKLSNISSFSFTNNLMAKHAIILTNSSCGRSKDEELMHKGKLKCMCLTTLSLGYCKPPARLFSEFFSKLCGLPVNVWPRPSLGVPVIISSANKIYKNPDIAIFLRWYQPSYRVFSGKRPRLWMRSMSTCVHHILVLTRFGDSCWLVHSGAKEWNRQLSY